MATTTIHLQNYFAIWFSCCWQLTDLSMLRILWELQTNFRFYPLKILVILYNCTVVALIFELITKIYSSVVIIWLCKYRFNKVQFHKLNAFYFKRCFIYLYHVTFYIPNIMVVEQNVVMLYDFSLSQLLLSHVCNGSRSIWFCCNILRFFLYRIISIMSWTI